MRAARPKRHWRPLWTAVQSGQITAEAVDLLWAWQAVGAPSEPRCLPESVLLSEATYAEEPARLDVLARHRNPWVRFVAADNPHTTLHALWGDGTTGFGLAGDDCPWVRATVLMSLHRPPGAVVAAFADAVSANA